MKASTALLESFGTSVAADEVKAIAQAANSPKTKAPRSTKNTRARDGMDHMLSSVDPIPEG
jgi:hypothetical protein